MGLRARDMQGDSNPVIVEGPQTLPVLNRSKPAWASVHVILAERTSIYLHKAGKDMFPLRASSLARLIENKTPRGLAGCIHHKPAWTWGPHGTLRRWEMHPPC